MISAVTGGVDVQAQVRRRGRRSVRRARKRSSARRGAGSARRRQARTGIRRVPPHVGRRRHADPAAGPGRHGRRAAPQRSGRQPRPIARQARPNAPSLGLHHAHRWADETPEPALALLPHLRSTLEAVAIEASTAVDVDDDLRVVDPFAVAVGMWRSSSTRVIGPGIRVPAKVRAATYAWSPGLDLAAQHSIQAFVGAVADAAGDHSLGALRRWAGSEPCCCCPPGHPMPTPPD